MSGSTLYFPKVEYKSAEQAHLLHVHSGLASTPVAHHVGQARSKDQLLLLQALQEDNVKVMTINPAQVSTPMTWSRPDSEYIPDLMIQPQEVADMCVFAFKVCAGSSFTLSVSSSPCQALSNFSVHFPCITFDSCCTASITWGQHGKGRGFTLTLLQQSSGMACT